MEDMEMQPQTAAESGEQAPDAGEQQKEKPSFEALLKSDPEYKAAYDTRVRAAIAGRFKKDQQSEAARQGRFRQVVAQSQALKQIYPGFRLEAEVKNPRFARLVAAGAPVREAFEVAHREEIFGGLAELAARDAARKYAAALQASRSRPSENGKGGSVGAELSPDPSRLTGEQRRQIREEVSKGKKVVF